MTTSPRLSLCMIVRDSSSTLGACLESISPWVDEVIVVDTGSVDNTREIALDAGARVFEFPWCDDFAAARNESLKHATGEWLFWMDSDDTISAENGQKLRELADRSREDAPAGYVIQVHCPGPPGTTDVTVVDHVKLFRNDSRLRFEGRIHEQILPAIRRAGGNVEWTDIFVEHSGSDHSEEARKRKYERDLRLLQMEVEDRPEHPFVLFNLGMTYADVDESALAIEYLERCIQVSAASESHVRKAYALLVSCLMRLGQDSDARQVLDNGQALFADDPELHFRRGILEHHCQNYDAAIEAYQRALKQETSRYFASRDAGISGFKARHNLANVYRDQGRLDHAELQWRLALEDEPNYLDGWRGLVNCLLEQKKHVTLEVEVEIAAANGLSPDEVAVARARLEAARSNPQRAIAILSDSIVALGAEQCVESLRYKCQLLFEQGSLNDAIQSLEMMSEMCPDDAAVWHNLGTAYQRAARTLDAIQCYEKSLAIRADSKATLNQLRDARRLLRESRVEVLPSHEIGTDQFTERLVAVPAG